MISVYLMGSASLRKSALKAFGYDSVEDNPNIKNNSQQLNVSAVQQSNSAQ